MTVHEILTVARGYIVDPKCWTKGAFARRADGGMIDPNSPKAVCWCAKGAVAKAEGSVGVGYSKGWHALDGVAGDDGIAFYNDICEHADVLALFDKAIAIAKDSGQ